MNYPNGSQNGSLTQVGVLFLKKFELENLDSSKAVWIERVKFLYKMREALVEIHRNAPQAKKNISRGFEDLVDFYEKRWGFTDIHTWTENLGNTWDMNNPHDRNELKAMSYENDMYFAEKSIKPPLPHFPQKEPFKVYFSIYRKIFRRNLNSNATPVSKVLNKAP